MAKLDLRRISRDRKQRVRRMVIRWKDSGKGFRHITEALEILSKPGRVRTRQRLAASGEQEEVEVFGTAFGFGHGHAPKGVLDMDDAKVLLSLARTVEQRVAASSLQVEGLNLVDVLDCVTAVLFERGEIPEKRDIIWEHAVEVLATIDLRLVQPRLL